jgi:hypothetical protein
MSSGVVPMGRVIKGGERIVSTPVGCPCQTPGEVWEIEGASDFGCRSASMQLLFAR